MSHSISAVARPNGQLRQAGVARGVRGHAPPTCIISINTAKILVIYIYIFFNCYILATKSFLRGSDDRLCQIKMIGEIRQNFTKASASVGLILATALSITSTNGSYEEKQIGQ